jgi:hypothetical protein
MAWTSRGGTLQDHYFTFSSFDYALYLALYLFDFAGIEYTFKDTELNPNAPSGEKLA